MSVVKLLVMICLQVVLLYFVAMCFSINTVLVYKYGPQRQLNHFQGCASNNVSLVTVYRQIIYFTDSVLTFHKF